MAALGAAALVVRRRTRAAESAHPPIGSFIEVDGVRLHYFEKGSGPRVVFLHGEGSIKCLQQVLSGIPSAKPRDESVRELRGRLTPGVEPGLDARSPLMRACRSG